MNQVAADIWPTLFATFLSALAMYIGFINKMRSQIAVLESKVKDLEEECEKATTKMNELEHTNGILEEKARRSEQRQDGFSKKNDDTNQLISEFKLEMMEKMGHLSEGIVKIQSDVEIINKTIAVFDTGMVSTKKRRK